MTPSRPYMVRAIYEWLNDNNCTPHVLVDARCSGVQIPQGFANDGQIVLNIAPGAVRDLFIRNDGLSFSARFGGVPMQVFAPMHAVLAIYGRENGQGMFFDASDDMAMVESDEGSGEEPPPESPPPRGTRPTLRVVK